MLDAADVWSGMFRPRRCCFRKCCFSEFWRACALDSSITVMKVLFCVASHSTPDSGYAHRAGDNMDGYRHYHCFGTAPIGYGLAVTASPATFAHER